MCAATSRNEDPAPQLELVKEAKVCDLLGDPRGIRLEVSGVFAKDDLFYLIFDNLPDVACIGASLTPGVGDNHLIPQERGHRTGFEDIAYDRWSNRFYVLIEALPYQADRFMAKVQEYDGEFRYTTGVWLDFPLDRPNKGLEGLTCIRRDGRSHLLGLCEGNGCAGGRRGRRAGEGRIQVFRESRHHWEHLRTIRLPRSLRFEDYSGIAVMDDRIAVVSQVSSALWVGSFAPSSWDLADEGATFAFPRESLSEIIYCNIEGVSWMTPDQVVVVSDRTKAARRSAGCDAKDESIHIFRIPRA